MLFIRHYIFATNTGNYFEMYIEHTNVCLGRPSPLLATQPLTPHALRSTHTYRLHHTQAYTDTNQTTTRFASRGNNIYTAVIIELTQFTEAGETRQLHRIPR